MKKKIEIKLKKNKKEEYLLYINIYIIIIYVLNMRLWLIYTDLGRLGLSTLEYTPNVASLNRNVSALL